MIEFTREKIMDAECLENFKRFEGKGSDAVPFRWLGWPEIKRRIEKGGLKVQIFDDF